jgi:hypothetical protein
MAYPTKETLFEVKRSSIVEYEDHPFQPSPVAMAQQRETKQEQPPRIVCGRLKARLHGRDRTFERDVSRRTEGHGLQI